MGGHEHPRSIEVYLLICCRTFAREQILVDLYLGTVSYTYCNLTFLIIISIVIAILLLLFLITIVAMGCGGTSILRLLLVVLEDNVFGTCVLRILEQVRIELEESAT